MAESWISFEMRNQVNSSEWAHDWNDALLRPRLQGFSSENCHSQCVMISLRKSLEKRSCHEIESFQSSSIFLRENNSILRFSHHLSLGFFHSPTLNNLCCFTQVVFVHCSLFITSFLSFLSPQLNYIRFINLASSVSRRGGEVKKKKRSHCVPEHISSEAKKEKSPAASKSVWKLIKIKQHDFFSCRVEIVLLCAAVFCFTLQRCEIKERKKFIRR